MHNYSSCLIYQTNNINPPKKKRYPLPSKRERERERERGVTSGKGRRRRRRRIGRELGDVDGVIVAKEGASIEGPNR